MGVWMIGTGNISIKPQAELEVRGLIYNGGFRFLHILVAKIYYFMLRYNKLGF